MPSKISDEEGEGLRKDEQEEELSSIFDDDKTRFMVSPGETEDDDLQAVLSVIAVAWTTVDPPVVPDPEDAELFVVLEAELDLRLTFPAALTVKICAPWSS